MTEPLSTERCSHCEQLGNLAWSLQQLAEGGERNECVKITLGRWEAAHLLSLLVAPSGAPGWKLEDVTRWHDLKTWPEFFRAVRENRKPFEVRLNDRDFQEGDGLRLHEWDPATEAYTGEIEVRRVSYMLTDLSMGVREGYAILGLHSFAAPPVPLEKASVEREEIAKIISEAILKEVDAEDCKATYRFFIEEDPYRNRECASNNAADAILKLLAERDGVVAPTSGWIVWNEAKNEGVVFVGEEAELDARQTASRSRGFERSALGVALAELYDEDDLIAEEVALSTPSSERLSSDRAGGGCEPPRNGDDPGDAR